MHVILLHAINTELKIVTDKYYYNIMKYAVSIMLLSDSGHFSEDVMV